MTINDLYHRSNARAPDIAPGSRIPLTKPNGISLKSGLANIAKPTPIHKYFNGNIAFSTLGYTPRPIIRRNSASALSLEAPSARFSVYDRS
mmetsp:Transcript_5380/g.9807  ORF Transcript_5380/g.9807 Transcript_5380/m.9807 type:complete len:91 (-) Transcript_5380:57-329(-)